MIQREYQAVRHGAGVVEGTDRGLIAVTGADRATYLQGLLTNDVVALARGSGCYAAYLTPQGRMITDLDVFNLGDTLLLDVPGRARGLLIERLNDLIFGEDVQVADWSESWVELAVHGPRAPDVVAAAGAAQVGALRVDPAQLAAFAPYQNGLLEANGARVVVARRDDLGVPGVLVYVLRGSAAAWLAALRAAGAIDVSRETADVLRVEAGRPAFGVDMDEDTIPLEAGIEDRAISFTKGCYVGQEVIFRVVSRGHGRVARRLAGLLPDCPANRVEGLRGAPLSHEGKDVGRITSAVWSPALSRPIALGYVHRDLVGEGTRIETAVDGVAVAVTVTALPFVKPG